MTDLVVEKKRRGPRTVAQRLARGASPEAIRRQMDVLRNKIQTSKLIDRVQRHAMGKVAMSPTQLTAAQALLRKTIPDLVGVKTEADFSPVVFNFNMGVPPKVINGKE